jgi:hypothetical protein
MATRWRCPPDSCEGRRSSRCPIWRRSDTSFHGLLAIRLGHAPDLEAEADVSGDGHVRVERVGLEHHRDVTFCGLQIVHPLARDPHVTLGDVFETRDHVQKRGLATSRRSHENQELAVLHGDIDLVQHFDGAVGLL